MTYPLSRTRVGVQITSEAMCRYVVLLKASESHCIRELFHSYIRLPGDNISLAQINYSCNLNV